MTAQIDDVFKYSERVFSIAGISEEELFNIAELGLEPSGVCTACWRGYQFVCKVLDRKLVIADLFVTLYTYAGHDSIPQTGPVINGVTPDCSNDKYSFFNNYYENINQPLAYSGGLLLADGFLEELYVHMGFHPAWKYKTVFELVFENGSLIGEFDRSEQVNKIREKITAQTDSQSNNWENSELDENMMLFVERSFERKY
ncbi:MAG: hypothetical protein HQ517_09845 [SAR324 cluster bacterium]|nr:hypothetical protein [SAR324 cluster bacterium]